MARNKQTKAVTKSGQTAKKGKAYANGKPAAGSSKSVRTVPARQLSKRSAEKETSVAVTQDLFRGAKSIEIMGNSISVTHASSRTVKGSFEKTERRRYVPKTKDTVAAVNAALYTDSAKIKKVRVEFK